MTDLLEHQWTSLSEPAVLPLTTEPMPEPLLRTTAGWKGGPLGDSLWAMASRRRHTPLSSEGLKEGPACLLTCLAWEGPAYLPGLGSRASATPR